MLKIKLGILANALILTCSAFASQECPSIEAIKAEGVSIAGHDDWYGYYMVGHRSYYDKDKPWFFAITFDDKGIESNAEAIEKANDVLSQMNTEGILRFDSSCVYETGNPEFGADALIDDKDPLNTIKHMIHLK